MSAAHSSSSSALFGSREYTSVTRALGELEARWPVQINVPGETLLILPVEGLDSQRLTEFASSGGREEEPFLIEASAASSAAAAAIQLVKLSRGLPAVLAASMTVMSDWTIRSSASTWKRSIALPSMP